MTTVTAELRPSFVDRAATRLSNWGTKVVGFFKKVGNWFVKGAKWLFNTKPVQWVVSSAQYVAGKAWIGVNWAWYYSKGLIMWVGVPTVAFLVAPKTVLVVLGLGVLALACIAFFLWRGYRHLRSISTHEELVELVENFNDRIDERLAVDSGPVTLQFDNDPAPGETVEGRLLYLDEQQKQAQNAADADKFSETFARMNLIEVRRNGVPGIRANATVSKIHQQGKKLAMDANADFEWNLDLMWRATQSENARLKVLEKQAGGQVVPIKK